MLIMKSKLFWLVLAVTVAGLIGIFAIAGNQPASQSTTEPSAAVTAQDHILGKPEAKVTLIEYADFQCPACANIEPSVNKLAEEYKDELRIVFRHFPISSIHPNAFPAARAAEAAAMQDKFWEMEDLLYERQREWAEDTNASNKFRQYAQELGLDVDKFNSDYNSQTVTDRINRDVTMGRNAEVGGTPTFFFKR